MYGGIEMAMNQFSKDSEDTLKALVVFTDGQAHDISKHSSVISTANNNGVKIDEEEKKNRQEIIMVDQSAVSEELNEKRVGTVYEVLTEGYDPIIKQYYGRTYADSDEIDGKVFFTSKTKIAPGSFVNVRISDYMEYDLYGAAEE